MKPIESVLKPGDRVECVKFDGNLGNTGTVKSFSGIGYVVDWDNTDGEKAGTESKYAKYWTGYLKKIDSVINIDDF